MPKKALAQKKRLTHKELEALLGGATSLLATMGLSGDNPVVFALSADGALRKFGTPLLDLYGGLRMIGEANSLTTDEIGIVLFAHATTKGTQTVQTVILATKTNQIATEIVFLDNSEPTIRDFGKVGGRLPDAMRETVRLML